MTKEDIKKALEACAKIDSPCNNCLYKDVENCYNTLKNDARELIIEQEKEIERLAEEKKQAQIDVLNKLKTNMVEDNILIEVCIWWHIDNLIEEVQSK